MPHTGGGGGADFHLPDEILSVIPTDPYDQLDLARRITSMAIGSRVSTLELEAARLRQRIVERDGVIEDLQDRADRLDRAVREADARLRAVVEENVGLSRERDSLLLATKNLSRDLAKLEMFKKHLMQSLNDDASSNPSESVDMGASDQSTCRSSVYNDEGATDYTRCYVATGSTEIATRAVEQNFSLTPYITPRLSPTATPKVKSNGNPPRGFSGTKSPIISSGRTSPTKSHREGNAMVSPWYPSSQQSSAASSPPRRPTMSGGRGIDGKEFFRQARTRLSYEQFGALLANIKELNSHRQTREETLKKADEIFGIENKDLYIFFQGMLTRTMS